MAHFSEQTWADFVRETDAGIDRAGVEAHLAAGCPECTAAFQLWTRVVQLAWRENEYTAPDHVVEVAKEQFRASEAEPESWTVAAALLFDNAVAPVPAGIRAGAAGTRQVVYEGEGLTVDMRFERRQHSNKVSASGQVLDKEVPLRWLGKAAIVLWNDKGEMIARTEAGEYGEFQFEFESRELLRISIATADRRTLRIALGNLE
jgi:hypothetical protein